MSVRREVSLEGSGSVGFRPGWDQSAERDKGANVCTAAAAAGACVLVNH